jgi:hypothetical protein
MCDFSDLDTPNAGGFLAKTYADVTEYAERTDLPAKISLDEGLGAIVIDTPGGVRMGYIWPPLTEGGEIEVQADGTMPLAVADVESGVVTLVMHYLVG